MTRTKIILLFAIATNLLLSCQKDEEILSPELKITGFSPTSAVAGANITITGSGFPENISDVHIRFDEIEATVIDATASQIVVAAPDIESTASIFLKVSEHVVKAEGQFTILHPPTISAIVPNSGAPGDIVTISGNHFDENAVVKLGELLVAVVDHTSTELQVIVPQFATTNIFKVNSKGMVAESSEFTIAPLTIQGFNTEGGLPGERIKIHGTGFSPVADFNKVFFPNDVEAGIISSTKEEIEITIPQGATSGTIQIEVGFQQAQSEELEIYKDIPKDGLIAFFPFSGNANSTINNLQGEVSGATSAPDRFGKVNHSYLFDGVNDVINLGNPELLQINHTITVSAWVSPSALSSSMKAIFTKIFFDPNQGGNPKGGFHLSKDDDTRFYMYGNASGALVLSQFAAFSFSAGQWVNVTYIIDGTDFKLFANGELISSGSQAQTIFTDGSKGDFTVGTYGGGFHFNGRIDDLAVYNKALSVAEVTQLYEQTISKR